MYVCCSLFQKMLHRNPQVLKNNITFLWKPRYFQADCLLRPFLLVLLHASKEVHVQGSHIYWKTWKNTVHLEKPGKIMEFCKKIIKIMEISWHFVSPEMWEPWDTVEMIYF